MFGGVVAIISLMNKGLLAASNHVKHINLVLTMNLKEISKSYYTAVMIG